MALIAMLSELELKHERIQFLLLCTDNFNYHWQRLEELLKEIRTSSPSQLKLNSFSSPAFLKLQNVLLFIQLDVQHNLIEEFMCVA